MLRLLKKIKKYSSVFWTSSFSILYLSLSTIAYADDSFKGPSIGNIASNVTGSFGDLATLITYGSYVAGCGFALSSILKFKQHKDNPQQIPIGTPIALLFVAAALIFLPTIFGTANETIFGGSGIIGGTTGVTS